MVWCRAGFRSDLLSVYTDLFTSHKPSKTTETRMHYTMCACCTTHQILFIKIAKKPLQSSVFVNFNHARKKGLSGKNVH